MPDCKLCTELRLRTGRKAWNEPLIESDNFVLIPSLGAMVEGWVLVVPKKHCISMGALPVELRNEKQHIERQARALLKSRYGKKILAFEHGPGAENHGTGCGVDHAHLHLVPLNCDLLTQVRPFVPASVEWRPSGWEQLAEAHAQGLDYLYFQAEGANAVMAVSQDFGSQVFRKAIASQLSMEVEYSWRD